MIAGEPLAEGSTVTVLAPSDHDESGFEVSPEEEAALLESIRQANRGEVVSAEELMRELEPLD